MASPADKLMSANEFNQKEVHSTQVVPPWRCWAVAASSSVGDNRGGV